MTYKQALPKYSLGNTIKICFFYICNLTNAESGYETALLFHSAGKLNWDPAPAHSIHQIPFHSHISGGILTGN